MTSTRRIARNAAVDNFFSTNIFSLVGPFTLDESDDKFTCVISGARGRSGFELEVLDSDTLPIGTIVKVGRTNLVLGRELVGDIVPLVAPKVTKAAAIKVDFETQLAALPSLSELYGEPESVEATLTEVAEVDDEEAAKADALADMGEEVDADEIDVDAEFSEILADYDLA